MSRPTDYDRALKSSAYLKLPDAGYLIVKGSDRVDFLQRQTTNDLRKLEDNWALGTVLTSPTARILDVNYLVQEDESSLGMTTLPARTQESLSYLQSRIFFNDNVSISDGSQMTAQFLVEGPEAEMILRKTGLDLPSKENEIRLSYSDDHEVKIIKQKGLARFGYRLIFGEDFQEALIEQLTRSGVIQLSDDSYEILRIEAGLPGPFGELTSDYTPLEVNMEGFISSDKGCYTGQEVIARQITYGKIARQLVGIQLQAPAKTGERVRADGRVAGTLTSSARSPRFGAIALAVLKRPYNEEGQKVLIGKQEIQGTVTTLPFHR